MKVTGEYSIHYDIFTMFNVYHIKITNNNLITRQGYEFFMKKWYQDETYSFEFGYLHENRFYGKKYIDDSYDEDLSTNEDGTYSTTTNYIDKDTYRQYRYMNGEFVDFNEKLHKICIGTYNYIDDETTKPSEDDTELYDLTSTEYEIEDFKARETELVLKCEMTDIDLNRTTEIGVKTNYGRLVSHDIHPPYNLPFGTNMTLEYAFKLK